MDRFLVFQSLWAMLNHHGQADLTLEEQVAQIAQAGFDGVTGHYSNSVEAQRLFSLASAANLHVEGQLFPRTVDDLAAALDAVSAFGCHHLTLQADSRPRTLKEAITLVEGWQRLAEQVDFPILLETHRYRVTNDLLFTLALLQEMPDLKLLADLSHYVVGRELPNPPGEEDNEQIQTILAHSWGFHGRVASCEQIQIPISFEHNRPWVDLFLDWWRYGINHWLSRDRKMESLSFTCELGPPPYAITDKQGHDVVDRWAESLLMKEMIKELWTDCMSDWSASFA
ncbi:sugar phosphate isomerase/epimerase [Pseudomonas luteola]|uniref:sugar phosphate isomerase/epimerase family protein n=1 Tax=Pseudomonas luteola TaxID=47886 RepID=UPI000F76AA23|nr:sugar phosphate isomerase/epimerase [Pseudomonas luteola]RRW40404.1 sugar phosphate isomerase/epimerase [Pseudomonas luteola]